MIKAFWDLTLGTVPEAARTPIWRALITLLIAGHVAWSCGWLPGMGGFAMADEVGANTAKLSTIEKAVVCNAVQSEIKRLRSELRSAETAMIEATNNPQLVTHLTSVLSDIRADIDDEVEKRNVNGCSIA